MSSLKQKYNHSSSDNSHFSKDMQAPARLLFDKLASFFKDELNYFIF